MKNPQMLANMLVANREVLTPYYRKLIDEGIADGSITTRYPRELSRAAAHPDQPLVHPPYLSRHARGANAQVRIHPRYA